MIYFKSCPRCNGDLVDQRDAFGGYRACLSCGFVQDPESPGLEVTLEKQVEHDLVAINQAA